MKRVTVWGIDGLIAAASAVISFLIFLPFTALGVDPHHDGIMLKPAIDVLEGQILHRDTFMQYGTLTPLFHASLLSIFGKKLLVLRVATLLLECLSLGLLYIIWRTILPRKSAIAAVLLWCCLPPFLLYGWHMLPWSSSLALALQCSCLCLLALAVRSRHRHFAILQMLFAGLFASATFWARQPVGGLLAISGTVATFTLHYRFRRLLNTDTAVGRDYLLRNPFLAAWAIGGLSLAAVMLGWLYTNDALAAWYDQSIAWPRYWASKYSFTAAIGLVATPREVLPLLVILLVLAILLRTLSMSRLPPSARRVAITILSLALWIFALMYPPLRHVHAIQKLLPVTMGLLLMLALLQRRFKLTTYVFHIGLMLPMIASLGQFYPVVCIRHMYWGITPAVGLFVFLIGRVLRLSPSQTVMAVLVFATPLGAFRALEGIQHLRQCAAPVSYPEFLAGMRPYKQTPAHMPWYKSAQADIDFFTCLHGYIANSHPGTPLIYIGEDALFALASENHTNASPFYIQWKMLEQFVPIDQINAFLLSEAPLIIIEHDPTKGHSKFAESIEQLALQNSYEKLPLGTAFRKQYHLLTSANSPHIQQAFSLPNVSR